jgi:hypothetical protein
VTLVVDDLLLLTALAGSASDELMAAMRGAELFTTSSWYYRLARASHDEGFSGALSSAIAALPPQEQALVRVSLEKLPASIGVVDARRVVPVMARLDVPRRLNFLAAEAVGSAALLGGAIRVTTESPVLASACRALAIDLKVLAL